MNSYTAVAYSFNCKKVGSGVYEMSWWLDLLYSGSPIRHPQRIIRHTYEKGAIRFCQKHHLHALRWGICAGCGDVDVAIETHHWYEHYGKDGPNYVNLCRRCNNLSSLKTTDGGHILPSWQKQLVLIQSGYLEEALLDEAISTEDRQPWEDLLGSAPEESVRDRGAVFDVAPLPFKVCWLF